MMISMVLSSLAAGQFMARVGKYRVLAIVGVATATVGMGLLATMGAEVSYGKIVRNMVVLGFGLGVTMPIFPLAVQNAVPHEIVGVASAASQFFRSMGGALPAGRVRGAPGKSIRTVVPGCASFAYFAINSASGPASDREPAGIAQSGDSNLDPAGYQHSGHVGTGRDTAGTGGNTRCAGNVAARRVYGRHMRHGRRDIGPSLTQGYPTASEQSAGPEYGRGVTKGLSFKGLSASPIS